jgi:hypothetical protein
MSLVESGAQPGGTPTAKILVAWKAVLGALFLMLGGWMSFVGITKVGFDGVQVAAILGLFVGGGLLLVFAHEIGCGRCKAQLTPRNFRYQPSSYEHLVRALEHGGAALQAFEEPPVPPTQEITRLCTRVCPTCGGIAFARVTLDAIGKRTFRLIRFGAERQLRPDEVGLVAKLTQTRPFDVI